MAIWYNLWPFGMYSVWSFGIFPLFGILCQEKSGNPDDHALIPSRNRNLDKSAFSTYDMHVDINQGSML
jgi:hypothetical protein